MKTSKTIAIAMCCFAVFLLLSGSAVNAQDWPMVNYNKERTSWVSEETILHPPLEQVAEIPVQSTGDYINLNYLTSYDGLLALGVGRYPNTLEAVDLETNQMIWSFEVPDSRGAMSFVCAQNDAFVFAGGQQGAGLYALHRESGSVLWSRDIGSLYTKHLILDGESGFLCADSITRLSLEDGATQWAIKEYVQSTPAVDDYFVFLAGQSRFRIYNKATGELEWSVPISSPSIGTAVVDASCFYTVSSDTVFAYHKQNRDVKWLYVTTDDTVQVDAQNSIAITDDVLVFTIRGNGDGDGEVVALNKETGAFLWDHTFTGNYVFAPTIANGVVYVVTFGEKALYAFDLQTGTLLFHDNSEEYMNQPIVANHRLYVSSRNKVTVFANDNTGIGGNVSPHLYALDQAFPNPVSEAARIRFSLPRAEFVSLKVYNTLGQEVLTLLSEDRSPGVHVIDLDASGLPAGVYQYKMEAGSFTDSRQFVRVR